jgi:hypothetical protein
MSPLVQIMKRLLRKSGRPSRRSTEAHFRIIREEQGLARSAFLVAHYCDGSPASVQNLLAKLWDLNSTALYIHIHEASSPADLVVSRHSGHCIVASGQKFRVETETHEPAPDGSYLVERQYRQLGFYETPPAERSVVVLRIAAGSGRAYLVDVPHYVSHVTVVVNSRTVADAERIPPRGELRYSPGGD